MLGVVGATVKTTAWCCTEILIYIEPLGNPQLSICIKLMYGLVFAYWKNLPLYMAWLACLAKFQQQNTAVWESAPAALSVLD